MEPEFTRKVSSRFVCDYLYFYFWLAVVVIVLAFAGGVGAAVAIKAPVTAKVLMILPYLISGTLGVLTALSFYIMCERGLKPGKEDEVKSDKSD